jgi:signal transduction histidine kinase
LIYARKRYKEPELRQNAIAQLLELVDIYEEFQDFDDIHNVYFLLGSIYDDNPEDTELAITAYEMGLILADWSAEAHNNLGVLYSNKQLIDKAVREFREAIKLDPDYASPYYNLAKIYFYQRNEEILRDFQRWIEDESGESAKILFNLSIALMDVGRAEACESIYSKAHAIKNLIGVAGSKLRRVCRESDFGVSEKLQEVLTDQEKCYNEMVNLLGALRHESLVLDLVDVNVILMSVISQIGFRSDNSQNQLNHGNIICYTDLDSSLPKVKGDARRLKDAFNNIVINSMEAIKNEGSIFLSTRYLDSTSEAEIIFKDTGIGIAHKDIDNIFKPGYTTKERGSGFGLSIVNRIIRDHRGNIHVSSQENEGTEISIHIPVNLELAPIQTSLRMRPVIYEDPSKLISTEVDQIVEA